MDKELAERLRAAGLPSNLQEMLDANLRTEIAMEKHKFLSTPAIRDAVNMLKTLLRHPDFQEMVDLVIHGALIAGFHAGGKSYAAMEERIKKEVGSAKLAELDSIVASHQTNKKEQS